MLWLKQILCYFSGNVETITNVHLLTLSDQREVEEEEEGKREAVEALAKRLKVSYD